MQQWQGTRKITVVTACMTHEGLPAFAINEADVTFEEFENGIHYYHVEADLMEAGYEEPFVHFDETEAPRFLHVAVKLSLGIPVVGEPISNSSLEEYSDAPHHRDRRQPHRRDDAPDQGLRR